MTIKKIKNYMSEKEVSIEKVDINKIKLNPKNPRTIKDDKFKKLVKSIEEFPKMLEVRPIVVDTDMVVLGGNMRLRACKEAGLKEVFIIKASHLTEKQKKEFLIKDNLSYGDWDYLSLDEFEELKDWGMDVPEWVFHEDEDENSLDDDFLNEIVGDYNKSKNELDDKLEIKQSTTTTAYMIFMLEEDDYNFIKKFESSILEKTSTTNLSDAVKKIILS